ncbi:hypothetical protein V6Z12_D12G210700 [Gossypium hirsutum]
MRFNQSTQTRYYGCRKCCLFPGMKSICILVVVFLLMLPNADAFDPLDPTGNITIKWDIVSWTADGYVAAVTMSNFQMYRSIMNPGWTLGWQWAKKEVIWSMVGAQTTEQVDCSKFKGNVPHCCKKNPIVVDLLPGVPYNQQFSNCCKAGVMSAWGQDPTGSVSAFQVSVGLAGTSNKTVKLPKNFNLLGPGLGYTCGPAKVVPSTVYLTPDRRRKTQALMTWNVTCTYSQYLASRNPSCCVSFSSFYNETITPCPTCACGCQNKNNCVMVHWHVKLNYKDYWRVKIAIMNFNYRMNYTQWTLVAQHPNLNSVTQVFSFDYKPLVPYESMTLSKPRLINTLIDADDTGMPQGNVQSEVLLGKNKDTFTFKQGWAFPRKVYFNGDECLLPPQDTYPFLPNSAKINSIAVPAMMLSLLMFILTL